MDACDHLPSADWHITRDVHAAAVAMTDFADLSKIIIVLFIVVFVLNLLPAFAPPTWTTMSFIGFTIPGINFYLFAAVAAIAATSGRIVLALSLIHI